MFLLVAMGSCAEVSVPTSMQALPGLRRVFLAQPHAVVLHFHDLASARAAFAAVKLWCVAACNIVDGNQSIERLAALTVHGRRELFKGSADVNLESISPSFLEPTSRAMRGGMTLEWHQFSGDAIFSDVWTKTLQPESKAPEAPAALGALGALGAAAAWKDRSQDMALLQADPPMPALKLPAAAAAVTTTTSDIVAGTKRVADVTKPPTQLVRRADGLDAHLSMHVFRGLTHFRRTGQEGKVNPACVASGFKSPEALLTHGFGVYLKPGDIHYQVTAGLCFDHTGKHIETPFCKRKALRFSIGYVNHLARGKRVIARVFERFYRMVRCWLRDLRARKAKGEVLSAADSRVNTDALTDADPVGLAYDQSSFAWSEADVSAGLNVEPESDTDEQDIINSKFRANSAMCVSKTALKLFRRYKQLLLVSSEDVSAVVIPMLTKRGQLPLPLPEQTPDDGLPLAKKRKLTTETSKTASTATTASTEATAATALTTVQPPAALRELTWAGWRAEWASAFVEEPTGGLSCRPGKPVETLLQVLRAVKRFALLGEDEGDDGIGMLRRVAASQGMLPSVHSAARLALADLQVLE